MLLFAKIVGKFFKYINMAAGVAELESEVPVRKFYFQF